MTINNVDFILGLLFQDSCHWIKDYKYVMLTIVAVDFYK